MTTSNFNLRGLSPHVMNSLKRQAKDLRISVNALIVRLIEEGLGLTEKPRRIVHHDLDFFFGTWSEKESKEFEENVKVFEKIDKEFWS